MKSIPRSFVKIDNYKYMYISKRWTWINKIKIPTTTVLMFRKFHQMVAGTILFISCLYLYQKPA